MSYFQLSIVQISIFWFKTIQVSIFQFFKLPKIGQFDVSTPILVSQYKNISVFERQNIKIVLFILLFFSR